MPPLNDIENRFTYHAPDARKRMVHARIRADCYSLAQAFNAELPEGREKSLALTHVEEAMFWANAAIAGNP